MKNIHADNDLSLGDAHGSVDTTLVKKGWRNIFFFLGPAYLVSVGYMDPGNWATDIAGGSKYGFTLIWVLLASNVMAVLLQSLSARLGIVRGRDLAQANRETYPRKINFILWLLAEIAIASTDLAELLGMAIGLQLLFGMPLIVGVGISVLDTFLLMYLQKLGIRKIEAFIIALIVVIGVCFSINIFISSPSIHEIIRGFIPQFPDATELYISKGIHGTIPKETALYLAIGIIGATVMPHNLYLHSALVQTRKIEKTTQGIRKAIKWNLVDSTIALNIAFLINAAILILAAQVFFRTGRTDVGEIKQAHELISPVLGSSIASKLFAIALIASGQSSTITGTLSGQIVMEGYLQIRINPLMRRLITRIVAIVPAIIVIVWMGEEKVNDLLIFSQVILSLQLGFAVIPLIHFVSDKKTMGQFAIKPVIKFIAWAMCALLVFLNSRMIIDESIRYFNESENPMMKFIIVSGFLFFILLLIYIMIHPLLNKNAKSSSIEMHGNIKSEVELTIPVYQKIAIALDFSDNDMKLISAAVGQAGLKKEFVLIHIVESPSSKIHGEHAADFETANDRERLELYVNMLKEKGFESKGILGFTHSAKEIARITKDEQADMLIIGAHGHRGIKDFIYGSTIDKVRHDLKIPVFIVNV